MRKEIDFIGEMELPSDVLYGIHAARARENFPDTTPFHQEWFKSIGLVKKACYQAAEAYEKAIFKKYGVYHYSTSREYRLLKEKLNEWIPLEQKSDFEIYSRNVWNETKKFKKKLFAKWDGKCYYTKIELDKNQHYNNETYPSVDHKISVFFGFSNNIDPIEIGKIDNLCICSRWSNHRKGIMNEEKFIEYLNENNFFNEK